MSYIIGAAIAAVVIAAAIVSGNFVVVTIYPYQQGLFYRAGVFKKLLKPGRHRYLKSRDFVRVVDLRRDLVALPGQEILTKDKVNLKISLVCTYEITDPVRVEHASTNVTQEFYAAAQLALRTLVAETTLDELLEQKTAFNATLLAAATAKALDLGLKVSDMAVRDIVLPPNLKRAYTGIIEAQKEAQRQLEKARGEQAVLRSLANSSSLYEANPGLLQARVIQAMASGNNTIVFGQGDALVVKERPAKA